MALELRFVDRHVLYANAVLVALNVDDAIDHQEWITVRQHFQHHLDVGRLKLVTVLSMTTVSFVRRRVGSPFCAQAAQAFSFRGTTA